MYAEQEIPLGGAMQVVSLEGSDSGAVMIMLHDVPWSPFIYGQAYRGCYPELSDNFGLVWWDQLGCGENHSQEVSPDMTVKDLADMAADLVDAIHEMFPDRKILLNGYSGGSLLAMYAGERRQDIVSGIICLSPVLSMAEAAEILAAVARQHGTDAELHRLEQARKMPPPALLNTAVTIADKYTGCEHCAGDGAHNSLSRKWRRRLYESKEWRLSDMIATARMARNARREHRAMWKSLMETDMRKTLDLISVPVLFLQGSEELYTLPEELEKLSDLHENITYIKYPRCGRVPTDECFPRMLDEMVRFGRLAADEQPAPADINDI